MAFKPKNNSNNKTTTNNNKPKKLQIKPETQTKLDQALELESKLTKLDGTPNPPEDKKSNYQTSLVEIFSEIVLTDPTIAIRKDVPGRLWRYCFYGRIGELRNRVSKEKMRYKKMQRKSGTSTAAAPPPTDSPEMEAQKQKIQANELALGTFLKESVTLYDWLVNQIMSQLFKAAASTDESTAHNNHHDSQSTTHTEQSSQLILSQSSTNSNSTTTTIPDSIKALKGQIPILHRMYIYLGDLHRYSNAFTQAESSYLKASCLAPGKGNPYNQLAVVAQLKDPTGTHPLPAVALYWYCRSLLAVHEVFETSRSNVERLFISNKNWMEKHMSNDADNDSSNSSNNSSSHISTTGMNREQARAIKSVASRKFLSRFVAFHGFLLSCQSFSSDQLAQKWESNKAELEIGILVDKFDALLTESAFSDALLLKIVCIMAFSIWNSSHSEVKPPATQDTKLLPFVAAVSLSYQIGATLSRHVTSSIDKITAKKKSGGAPLFTGNIRLLSPLLLLLEFMAYIGSESGSGGGDEIIFNLLETFTNGGDEILQKLLRKSRHLLWEDVAGLSNLLRKTEPISTFVESGEEEDASMLLPKDFRLLAKGYKPFYFLVQDEDVIQLTSESQQSSKSSVDSIRPTYAYLPLEEAIDALEISGVAPPVASQSTLSQRSKKSTDSKNPSKTTSESRRKLRWAIKFVSDCIEKKVLIVDEDDMVIVGPSMMMNITGINSISDEEADPVVDFNPPQLPSPPAFGNGPNLTKLVSLETESQLQEDADDVIVYKPTDSGKALLVPGALLLADNKCKEEKRQDNLSSTLAGASSKQDGDVVRTNDNPVSSSFLNLSSLLNETSKEKEPPSKDIVMLNPACFDSFKNSSIGVRGTSLPPMPQSSEPPLMQGGGAAAHIRPPPGFHAPVTNPTQQPTASLGAPPGLNFLGNTSMQTEAATLTSNLPAFSNTFDSNIDVPAAPGLGSFLNDNQPENPFGTRNPFAISMPSLGYGNQMTLDTQTMETTKVNGSNEIPPSQSSRLSEYTKVKNDTPTDLNSLSFDFDQNDFLRNLGIFSGDEETQAAEGSGISSLLSSSLNGKSTTSGDEYTTCTTNSTPFTKNPFA